MRLMSSATWLRRCVLSPSAATAVAAVLVLPATAAELPPAAPPAEGIARQEPPIAYPPFLRRFDSNDEAAALEAVQVALTEVGDGSSYVWYRRGGRLSGVVQPTQSFMDLRGRVCRHLVVTLSAEGQSRRTGAIACRLADGGWTLDG